MIKVEKLHKYFKDLHVLKGIDLEVRKKEVVTIVGAPGSGKSTLLRCIGLGIGDEGEISFKCKNIHHTVLEFSKVKQGIGIVFQHLNLFPHKTVLENIIEAPILVQKKRKEEATTTGLNVLRKVRLLEKAHVYPDNLSRGQKQIVAIARVLAMNPGIILFDEPTTALDPESTEEVLRVIRRLAEGGMTMLIVTDKVDFICQIADRIFLLENGVIVESGTPDEIFTNPKMKKTKQFLKEV